MGREGRCILHSSSIILDFAQLSLSGSIINEVDDFAQTARAWERPAFGTRRAVGRPRCSLGLRARLPGEPGWSGTSLRGRACWAGVCVWCVCRVRGALFPCSASFFPFFSASWWRVAAAVFFDQLCCFVREDWKDRTFAAMAEQQQQQERPGVRRRSSLGRAMERMRDALKKRRSSAQGTPTLQSTREEGAAAAARPAEQQQQQAQPPAPTTAREPKAAEPRESTADSQLEADDLVEDEADINEEPLTTAFSSRTGISEDKAKALFERYGIKYQPRTTAAAADGDAAGQTNKVRRVERPVRIRIHWTCHQCQRQFGTASACVSCGHRRCGDCARSPPKRVKAIVDEAKEGQLAAANKGQILAAVAPTTADKLDVDDADDDNPVDLSQLSMETRPNSGIKLVMRSKPPSMRRICHECQTPFRSKSSAQCEQCSHQRCDACPVRAAKMAGEQPPFEPTMVASVQRVYRKPRQRVRWQCDKCQTTIVDGHRCGRCNHERCGECVRSP